MKRLGFTKSCIYLIWKYLFVEERADKNITDGKNIIPSGAAS
jgi:hypothetical protein